MSSAQVDPHDKMRARDVNKVAKGEQAPRPVHEFGTVSKPPPPSSTDHLVCFSLFFLQFEFLKSHFFSYEKYSILYENYFKKFKLSYTILLTK